METGRTVILLNLENLYESLYDALNQVSLVKLASGEYCRLRLLDTQTHTATLTMLSCNSSSMRGQTNKKLTSICLLQEQKPKSVIDCRIPTEEKLGKIAIEPEFLFWESERFRNSRYHKLREKIQWNFDI